MYDLLYVRKHRRRRIAALVSLISAIGVTSLVVVSFLGRFVGTFTVSLTNSAVRLSLSEKQAFTETTSYIIVDKLNPFEENTFRNLPPVDVLDNEDTSFDYGKNVSEMNGQETLEYFKYTFYVKNVGNTIAQYNMSIKIDEKSKANDGTNRTLDETMRVMVFENDPTLLEDTHDYKIYAKPSHEVNYDKDGNRTYQEFVSEFDEKTNKEDDEHPLAESFLADGKTVAKYSVDNFGKSDIRRYTLVIWLEGADPDSDNKKNSPVGAKIKLGVEITAYENE